VSAVADAIVTPPKRGMDQGWIVMFTDLVCLMLTFFVLLFTMANPEPRLWKEITVETSPGAKSVTWKPPQVEMSEFAVRESEAALELTYLGALLRRQITIAGGLRDVSVRTHGDHITISLPSELLFESGSATVSKRGGEALFVVAGAVANVSNGIEVFGHTDPVPSDGTGFVSNWELSLARALAVSESVRRAGYDRPMLVQGFADGRFFEIPDDLTEARRYALARRVDIILRPDRHAAGGAK
jgi:chemotaxis protein MotB